MEEDKNKKQTFFDKYSKQIAIISLVFAILLLIYTIYNVIPRKLPQSGGDCPIGYGKHMAGGKKIKLRKILGGSCGCSAGLSLQR